MHQAYLNDLAALLLRIALGAMFIAHSWYLKLFVFTLSGTADFFASIGLPRWFGYFIFGAEALAGLMLVLGIQARWVALATVPILAGATWAHWGNGWMFGYENGGWEYPVFLSAATGVLAGAVPHLPHGLARPGVDDPPVVVHLAVSLVV